MIILIIFPLVNTISDLQKKFESVRHEQVKCSKELEAIKQDKINEESGLKEVKEQYEKLKALLEQKDYARKRRENTATTMESIQSVSN